MNREKVYLNSIEIQKIGTGNIPSINEFNEVWQHISLHGFMFNDYWIICEDSNIKYQVVIEKAIDFLQIVSIKKIWYDKDNLAHNLKVSLPIFQYRLKYIEMINNSDAEIDENFKEALIPMMFMQYVTYANLHREIVKIEATEREKSNTSTSRSSKNNQTRYSLTDCIKIYQHKNKNKKYEYHLESWTRRGGIRHYKSGKIVTFSGSTCRPRNKGTETNNREYKL